MSDHKQCHQKPHSLAVDSTKICHPHSTTLPRKMTHLTACMSRPTPPPHSHQLFTPTLCYHIRLSTHFLLSTWSYQLLCLPINALNNLTTSIYNISLDRELSTIHNDLSATLHIHRHIQIITGIRNMGGAWFGQSF